MSSETGGFGAYRFHQCVVVHEKCQLNGVVTLRFSYYR